MLSLRAGALTPCGPILWWSSLCTALCWCIDALHDGAPCLPSRVDRCGACPDCGGCHCAQPSCWCIDTPRSHLVVVVFVHSLCAGALTPCMMVRLVWLHGWTGAGQALCGVSASQRRDACIPGLWVVGRLRLSKPAKNDPWAGLQGRVGRSGRAPAQGCSLFSCTSSGGGV